MTTEFTEEEFLNNELNKFVYEREPDAEIFNEGGQDLISLNGHVFELDRSVPQLGDYVGEEGNLPPAIRKINVTNKTLSEISIEVITARAEGVKYRYSYKKLNEEDTEYKQVNESETNTNTYTGLTSPEKYTIKVDLVKDDKIVDTEEITVVLGELEEGIITFDDTKWIGNGMASVVVRTTSNYQLQYQIGGIKGSWTTISNGGTIGNIPNNTEVYARLWDGTNASDYASVKVEDNTAPTITKFEATDVTYNSITVQVEASDNESGLSSTNTYKFYLNDETTEKGTITDGTFTYESLSGLTNYKLRVEVYDNAGNVEDDEIEVTTKELPLEDALDITGNKKVYVEIPNKKGGTILCNVLYNDETNGLQIISVNSVETVTLGSNDFTTSMNSYNSAIETLNGKAEEYNYFGSEYVEARCVGSNPTNPSAQSGMHTTQFSSIYNGKLRDIDSNYETDYNKMTALGIARSNAYYWLASRYVGSGSYSSGFGVRNVNSSGGLLSSNVLCYVFSSGSASAKSYSNGLRPVFHLKSGIKITGGDGSSENPYVLEV